VDRENHALAMPAGVLIPTPCKAFVDTFKDQYNKLDTSGFAFATHAARFSFEQLEKEYSINAMATYVDLNSPGTPISFEGESLSRGKIPENEKVRPHSTKTNIANAYS